jgi:hypothetical protein
MSNDSLAFSMISALTPPSGVTTGARVGSSCSDFVLLRDDRPNIGIVSLFAGRVNCGMGSKSESSLPKNIEDPLENCRRCLGFGELSRAGKRSSNCWVDPGEDWAESVRARSRDIAKVENERSNNRSGRP